MSRDTVSSVTSHFAQTQFQASLLCKLALNSSTLYACTGNRFVTDGTNTYTPVGGFGGVGDIQEDANPKSRTLRVWVSALNSAALYEPFTEALFNKDIRLYRAAVSGSNTCVGTPQQIYRGFVNKVDVKLGDEQRGNYYELECESRLYRESSTAYYSKEFLWRTYSGDTGLDYVPRIAGFQSNWGGKTQQFSGLVPSAGADPSLALGRPHGGGDFA